jgi:Domain of unknown function (DUF4430)
VFRRSLVVSGAVVAALVVAAPALAARVHVRIEGAGTTLWGAEEPWVTPVVGTITPPSGPDVTVNMDTPFGALERASQRGEIWYEVTSTSFGPYVSQIGRTAPSGPTGWVYKVNGVSPPVGAVDYELHDGDTVLWYFATFGPNGGPQTLVVRKTKKPKLCFQAFAQNDAGAEAAVGKVIFRVNGVTVRSKSGTYCPAKRIRSIRVTREGFVRSAVLVGARVH